MANDIEVEINNAMIEDIKTKTDFFHNSLVSAVEKSKLPEEIFKNYFLPHFAGQVSSSKNPKVIAEWIGVAGTPMSEVDIINAAGDVIFTVPSLLGTDIIETVKRAPGKSLADIYQQYDLHKNHLPVVANTYLSNELSTKLENINTTDDKPIAAGNRWTDILARYNIKTPDTVALKKSHNEDSDDVIYE